MTADQLALDGQDIGVVHRQHESGTGPHPERSDPQGEHDRETDDPEQETQR